MTNDFWKRLTRTDARAFFWVVMFLLLLVGLWWIRWESRARRESLEAFIATLPRERRPTEEVREPPDTVEQAVSLHSPFTSAYLDATVVQLEEDRRRQKEEAARREEERRRSEEARRRAEEERERAAEERRRLEEERRRVERERQLLEEERRKDREPPPAAEEEPPAVAEEPRRTTLSYRGKMRRTDGVTVAFVEREGDDRRRPYETGERIAGWLVERIEPNRLFLSGGARGEATLILGEVSDLEELDP